MEQLVAKNEVDYVSKAVNLSINHEEYANVRSLVFANALSSPLFNSKDYTKSFFEALQKIV